MGSPGQGRRPRGLGYAHLAGKPGKAPGAPGLPTGPITTTGVILPLGLWASQTTPLPYIFQGRIRKPSQRRKQGGVEGRGQRSSPASCSPASLSLAWVGAESSSLQE